MAAQSSQCVTEATDRIERSKSPTRRSRQGIFRFFSFTLLSLPVGSTVFTILLPKSDLCPAQRRQKRHIKYVCMYVLM